MNVNELILDKVRSLIFTDLSDGSVIGRLTNLEEPSLQTAAEGEEIKDAQGALITRLFRTKTGKFTASNSLFSTDLLAMQYGSDKEIADDTTKITVPIEETLTVENGKVTLSHTPLNDIRYIYSLESGHKVYARGSRKRHGILHHGSGNHGADRRNRKNLCGI